MTYGVFNTLAEFIGKFLPLYYTGLVRTPYNTWLPVKSRSEKALGIKVRYRLQFFFPNRWAKSPTNDQQYVHKGYPLTILAYASNNKRRLK